jgi:hypothetical protein
MEWIEIFQSISRTNDYQSITYTNRSAKRSKINRFNTTTKFNLSLNQTIQIGSTDLPTTITTKFVK